MFGKLTCLILLLFCAHARAEDTLPVTSIIAGGHIDEILDRLPYKANTARVTLKATQASNRQHLIVTYNGGVATEDLQPMLTVIGYKALAAPFSGQWQLQVRGNRQFARVNAYHATPGFSKDVNCNWRVQRAHWGWTVVSALCDMIEPPLAVE